MSVWTLSGLDNANTRNELSNHVIFVKKPIVTSSERKCAKISIFFQCFHFYKKDAMETVRYLRLHNFSVLARYLDT